MIVSYLDGIIGDEMVLNSFIRDMEIISQNSTSVIFQVNSEHAKEIIEKEYKNAILQAVESVFNKPLSAKFVLGREVSLFEKKESVAVSKNISKKFLFEDYVKAGFNSEVFEMATRVAENPGKYSPFYIASKSGLGKTHLLHAIGNKIIEIGKSAIYIEPNRFTKDVQKAAQEGGNAISNFADSYKKYDVLLFDDIQNLGDRSVTLKVLFEIINNQIENGKQVIIVSDKVAQELSGFESRFITRFISGISSKIKEPNTNDMIMILKKKLEKEEMRPEEWENEALSFIARNNTSSIRALEGAVKRIAFYTENDKHVKYTYVVVSNIFKDLAIDPSELTPVRIINIVASYYRITKKDITGKSRKKDLVLPRHIAIYLIREIIGIGYTEIGKYFGGRDHSTIISAVKSIDRSMKIDKALKLAISSLEQRVKTAT
ncbi:MAG: chromosomal replication initiator protein DnaA [Mycoplasmatales bacterium]|nr:chromosomal replication initiator protein DnaA [Mycoplasmatales bacterium]